MKLATTALTILVCTIGASYCADLTAKIPGFHAANVPLTALRSSREETSIVKRSTLQRRQIDFNQLLDCFVPAVEVECTSGYAQRVVDTAVYCGQNAIANFSAGGCATNPDGDYCAIVLLRGIAELTTTFISCSSEDLNTCSPQCTAALQAIRGSYGCCINSVFNATISIGNAGGDPLAELFETLVFDEEFSYALWSNCGVETISTRCDNTITVTQIHDTPVCTPSEYLQQAVEIECGSEGQDLIDAILEIDGCYEIARESIVSSCSINSDGQYCSVLVTESLLSSDNDTPVTISNIISNCSPSQTSCSPACRSAVEAVRNEFGCCVNSVYNSTQIAAGASGGLYFVNYTLWDQCGVGTPGFCETTLNGSPVSAQALPLFTLAALVGIVQYVLA